MAFTEDLKKLTQFRHSLTLGQKQTARHLRGSRWELLQLQHVCQRYSPYADAWLSEPMATQMNFVFQCTRGGAKYYLARLLPYKRNIFLIFAAAKKYVWLVRYLLLIGAPTEFSVGYPSLKITDLYFKTAATITDDLSVLKELIAAGAATDKIDVEIFSDTKSLQFALGAGVRIVDLDFYLHQLEKDPEILAILLKFGGNINEQVKPRTLNIYFIEFLYNNQNVTTYEFIIRTAYKFVDYGANVGLTIDVATTFADLSLICDTVVVSHVISKIWEHLTPANQKKYLQQGWFLRM